MTMVRYMASVKMPMPTAMEAMMSENSADMYVYMYVHVHLPYIHIQVYVYMSSDAHATIPRAQA